MIGNFAQDASLHFPAGDKSSYFGAERRSQIRAALGKKRTPYEYFNFRYFWRNNPCGDLKGRKDQLRGRKFYNGRHIAANYSVNQVIDIGFTIVGHHNGLVEFHPCHVEKCPGKRMSPVVFRSQHCYKIKRSCNRTFEPRNSWRCGQIDKNTQLSLVPSLFEVPIKQLQH